MNKYNLIIINFKNKPMNAEKEKHCEEILNLYTETQDGQVMWNLLKNGCTQETRPTKRNEAIENLLDSIEGFLRDKRGEENSFRQISIHYHRKAFELFIEKKLGR